MSAGSLLRLVIAGIVLPAAMVAVNQYLLGELAANWRPGWTVRLTIAAYLVEVAVMGLVCSYWIDRPLTRWLIYGWCWLNIDFQGALSFYYSGQTWWGYEQSQCVSLFAAQIGLVVVWSILGPGRWTVRWAVGLLLAALLALPLLHFRFYIGLFSGSSSSTVLLGSQFAVLLALCGLLRQCGFVLAIPAASQPVDNSRHAQRLGMSQFGVRDVLIWTTVLAGICGLARAVGLPLAAWLGDDYSMWFVTASIGAAAGIALLAALWAALSEATATRRHWTGLVLLVAAAVLAGISDWLTWIFGRGRIWLGRRSLSGFDYGMLFLYDEEGVLFWIIMTGGMLFATLLFVRGLGYRLTRTERTGRSGVPADCQASLIVHAATSSTGTTSNRSIWAARSMSFS
jgi:hypothetical protein